MSPCPQCHHLFGEIKVALRFRASRFPALNRPPDLCIDGRVSILNKEEALKFVLGYGQHTRNVAGVYFIRSPWCFRIHPWCKWGGLPWAGWEHDRLGGEENASQRAG